MTCRRGPDLPEWADGMQDEYIRWVDYSNRLPCQLDDLEFEFRYNTNVELVEWIEAAPHNSEIRVNPAGYLARIKFDKPDGAMHFKLRWL